MFCQQCTSIRLFTAKENLWHSYVNMFSCTLESKMTKEELFWSIFHLIYLKTASLLRWLAIFTQTIHLQCSEVEEMLSSLKSNRYLNGLIQAPFTGCQQHPLQNCHFKIGWIIGSKMRRVKSFSFHFDLFGWCWWRVKYLTLLLCFQTGGYLTYVVKVFFLFFLKRKCGNINELWIFNTFVKHFHTFFSFLFQLLNY